MGLADRVVGAVRGAISPRKSERADDRRAQLEAEVEAAKAEIGAARASAATALRQKDEMFDTVERVCAQRQQWQSMYHDAVACYHGGLRVLEGALARERRTLQQAVLAFNALRKEHGLEPVARPEDLPQANDPPVGQAEVFDRAIAKLDESAPANVDGLAEREAVVRTEDVIVPSQEEQP